VAGGKRTIAATTESHSIGLEGIDETGEPGEAGLALHQGPALVLIKQQRELKTPGNILEGKAKLGQDDEKGGERGVFGKEANGVWIAGGLEERFRT
jgi:hypothetical protein